MVNWSGPSSKGEIPMVREELKRFTPTDKFMLSLLSWLKLSNEKSLKSRGNFLVILRPIIPPPIECDKLACDLPVSCSLSFSLNR